MREVAEMSLKESGEHYFGGNWTTDKLDRLRRYLAAYSLVMSKQPFRYAYVDAFAGTGYISKDSASEDELFLFAELNQPESRGFIEGSAKVALSVEPAFSEYIFVEKSAKRCQDLATMRDEHPALASRVAIVNAEANAYLQGLCENGDWKRRRAVLFLDPYGMQVEWRTLEAIASTRAIDMWLLFPLGMSISRLLTRDGKIPQAWVDKLDRFLGTHDWMSEFYKQEMENTLFGEQSALVRDCSFDRIAAYFVRRLKEIFPVVAENPLTLRNSKIPLFLLCFAAGNGGRGGEIAKRIAENILTRRT
jgi:three-Cys-motif partner protein